VVHDPTINPILGNSTSDIAHSPDNFRGALMSSGCFLRLWRRQTIWRSLEFMDL